jgi:hypothetical protein
VIYSTCRQMPAFQLPETITHRVPSKTAAALIHPLFIEGVAWSVQRVPPVARSDDMSHGPKPVPLFA